MEIKKSFKGGGSFVSVPPKFSTDSENIYIAWNHQVLSYNVKTSKPVAKYLGIKSKIIDFHLFNYQNLYDNIAACSQTGHLIVWKLDTRFKLQNLKIGVKNVDTFNIISLESGEIKALISTRSNGKVIFFLYDLQSGNLRNYSLKIDDTKFSVSVGSNDYFVVTQNSNLFIVKLNNFQQIWRYNIDNSRTFTCVTCHPTELVILTGDSTGRIVLWQNLFENKLTQAVFHWHTLPVKSVAFSTAGSYFYSGGDESVLVKWQLENTFEKSFLPRLSANIKQISVSNENRYIALATEDNAVQIFDSRFDRINTIQNLVIGDSWRGSGILWDSRTRALVMNGNIGHLQFYLPHDSNLLYNVDIVGQNKITNERNCNIANTQITKFAISKNGLWLATVEENHQLVESPEIRMKFWNFDQQQQLFKLNTSIEYPHPTSVTAIEFQPLELEEHLKLVTVSSKDKTFKIWELVDATTIYKQSSAWKFYGTGFYRDLQCDDLSFSIDGSLIAINFDYFLTIWVPDSCELKSSLVHTKYKEKINRIEFGRGNQCHLIVTAGCNLLSVWNILTLTMIWTVPVHVGLLIKNPITTHMAVITQQRKVLIFSPESPKLIYESDEILKDHQQIMSAAFAPNKYSSDIRLQWYQRSSLFFIDNNQELYCIGDDNSSEMATTKYEENEDESSVFDKINPKSKLDERNQAQDNVQILPEHKNIKKYLEAPVHSMIPIRIMAKSLLKSMIMQKL